MINRKNLNQSFNTMNPRTSMNQQGFMNPRDSMSQPGIKTNMINSGSFGQFPNSQEPIANTYIKQMGQGFNDMQQNNYIKDSGAPVNFDPNSIQNISGMFGMPVQNSYDRTMNPYNGGEYTGDQAMY